MLVCGVVLVFFFAHCERLANARDFLAAAAFAETVFYGLLTPVACAYAQGHPYYASFEGKSVRKHFVY